ncbi:MFS transporter [Microbacterium sp. NPDC077663]|uniref:MFS transporter n=1 Tax=Microbacterium sp. NPDC077663 TaxID=3364189 RepID=UPI0037C8ABFB
MTQTLASSSLPPRTAYRFRWVALAALLAAEVMDVLDTTAVTIAGPALERELGVSGATLQWIIGGYALAIGAGLVLGGRLGDRFGRRRVFLIGVAAFTLASLLCALAPGAGWLVALRLIQGAAGALILPQSFGIIRVIFPPEQRAAALGTIGPVMSLASVLGPVIGGLLLQADLLGTGWRAIFLINIPVGLAVFALAWRLLPAEQPDRTARIDITGAVLLVASCTTLVFPLIQAEQAGWTIWSWACLAGALAGFVAFAAYQRRAAARGRAYLVVPSILKKRAFIVGVLGTLLFFACQVGTQLVLTLHLQLGLDYSAGAAGIAGIPFAIGIAIGAALAGAVLAKRLGRRALLLGASTQALGTGSLILCLALPLGRGIWPLVPGLVLAGVGAGIVLATLFDLVVSSFEDNEVGSGSGMLSASQSIGSAIGVGAFGSIFFTVTASSASASGFIAALVACAVILVLFAALTFLLPKALRNEETP